MKGEIEIRRFSVLDAAAVRDLFIRINRLLAPPHMKDAFEGYIDRSLKEEIDRIEDYYAEKHGRYLGLASHLHLLGHNVEIQTLVRLFLYFSSSILINQQDQVPICNGKAVVPRIACRLPWFGGGMGRPTSRLGSSFPMVSVPRSLERKDHRSRPEAIL